MLTTAGISSRGDVMGISAYASKSHLPLAGPRPFPSPSRARFCLCARCAWTDFKTTHRRVRPRHGLRFQIVGGLDDDRGRKSNCRDVQSVLSETGESILFVWIRLVFRMEIEGELWGVVRRHPVTNSRFLFFLAGSDGWMLPFTQYPPFLHAEWMTSGWGSWGGPGAGRHRLEGQGASPLDLWRSTRRFDDVNGSTARCVVSSTR